MNSKAVSLKDLANGQQAILVALQDIYAKLHNLQTEPGIDTINERFDRLEDQSDRIEARLDSLLGPDVNYEH